MSLGIVFKGPEGIVLAADSRVTLHARILDPQDPKKIEEIASYYDNATKLLYVNKQPFIGVVTYGVGAIGQKEPRTAHSYIPEFQDEIPDGNNDKKLWLIDNVLIKIYNLLILQIIISFYIHIHF